MTYSIHITAQAEKDLNAAADYIEYKLMNPSAADRFLDEVSKKAASLSSMPERNKLADDPVLRAWGIRYILVGCYILFYVIQDKTVYIVRILYGHRNWQQILRAEPLSFT